MVAGARSVEDGRLGLTGRNDEDRDSRGCQLKAKGFREGLERVLGHAVWSVEWRCEEAFA